MSYSGYGDWNSGTNRGYEGYGYSYGYSQENSGNYGYGMATSTSWEVANSDMDVNPDGSSAAEGALGKMNLETDAMQGAHYGSGDRYDSYDSYDSRPSTAERDAYRPGYDYGEAERDNDGSYEGPYDGFYGNRRDQFQARARENVGQRGQNWGRENRSNRPLASAYPGRMSGQWTEAPQAMGSRGPYGSSRLPSLFSHNIIPELGMFQGMRGFQGGMRYGGGMMKQRMRRSWRMWDSDYKPQKKKLRKEPSTKKRKLPNSSDDAESRAARTDGSENSDSGNEEGTEGESGEKEEKEGSRGEGEEEEGKDTEKGALTIQEEISRMKRRTPERQKKRHRDRMVERIQFVCSLCKYRTFYDDEMSGHLESQFHKEHFKFVGTKLPQQTADFLQEYVANKTRKTEERRKGIEDINAVIQQIYRDQDLTQDVGMEHFIKKVEAAHCAACDLFIPMQYGIIQKHLKSLDHNHNRRAMMEQSKKSSLVVARSILNNKLISKKLERYLKGENPFTDDPEEKEEQEDGEGASGNVEEGGDENKDEEENLEEENPEEENKDAKGDLEAERAGNGGEQEERGTETAQAQAQAEMEWAAGNVEEQNSLLPEEGEHQRAEDEEGSEEAAAAQEEEDGD
ncbi:A-kinase anchor protein 8-like [Neopsephotus bourkii]|uniref:A-kinase anchor protein 8-like n=1 Tax=Neopsephotus bourkii TaxID=309878 RepID=UPI002AA5C272|nr:A-kinase anchor protein 8-like [Neopsephotus bourkii]